MAVPLSQKGKKAVSESTQSNSVNPMKQKLTNWYSPFEKKIHKIIPAKTKTRLKRNHFPATFSPEACIDDVGEGGGVGTYLICHALSMKCMYYLRLF